MRKLNRRIRGERGVSNRLLLVREVLDREVISI